MNRKAYISLGLLWLAWHGVAASTLYVSQTSPAPTRPYATWDTGAHTIQEAVDAASDGDTVLVGAGEYALTNQVTITKGILLRSDSGSSQTILKGQGGRCLWISNSLAVVDGFTVSNGLAEEGGGVFLVGATVQNCIITRNQARSRLGSGVTMIGGRLLSSIVTGNYFGDAVYCSSGGLIEGCQIRGTRDAREVHLINSQIRSCIISGSSSGNTGTPFGAGIYAFASTIVDCTISNCYTRYPMAGGAYLDQCEMDRCMIVRNSCGLIFGSAGRGGGIFATNSVIRNCLIANNGASNGSDSSGDGRAPGFGGGVYLRGGSLLNCTVTGNESSGGAGGIYVESGAIKNSIIYFNSAPTNVNWHNVGGGSFDHSCTTPEPGGVGNITVDPQFVSRMNRNYRLVPTSPCIDAGINEPWMTADARDLDGNPRVRNGTVDLGAWESTNTSPAIVTHPPSQTVTNASEVNFSVTANGVRPLGYAWHKDGITIPDAINSTLTLFNVSSSDAGVYSVVVSNFAGWTMSSNAVLTVITNMVPVVAWMRPTNSASMVLSTTLNNPTPADNRNLAISVAVSGTRVVVGSPGYRADGSSVRMAYVYDLTSATPATPVVRLRNPCQATLTNPCPANFGGSVAIAGTRILVGAWGSAYVYELTNAAPATPAITLASPSAESWGVFGTAVGMSGTRFVVGARNVAYVYDLGTGTPEVPIATLTNPPGVSEWFGYSVAISGTFVVVGAALYDAGSAYVYDLASAEPTVPVATLNNPAPDPSDDFGWSMAMSGSRLVIGARRDNFGEGRAYVYDLASLATGVPVLTLTNPSPAPYDYFGWSVGLSGTRVVVAAPGDETGATNTGSAYVYDLASGRPAVPIATLVNPSPAAGNWFGHSVAIDDATVIAAPANDNTPDDGGLVHVFNPEPGPSFAAGSDILLSVRATDSDGSVSFVDFFANSMSLGRVVSSTDVYELVWSNAPAGTFQLHAEAVDNVGGHAASDAVVITVDSPPTLSIRPAGSGFLTISWAPSLSGFVLQYSDRLAPADWVTASGATNRAAISIDNSTRFYRLFRP